VEQVTQFPADGFSSMFQETGPARRIQHYVRRFFNEGVRRQSDGRLIFSAFGFALRSEAEVGDDRNALRKIEVPVSGAGWNDNNPGA